MRPIYEHRNARRQDFDIEKVRGMTPSRWAERLVEPKRGRKSRRRIALRQLAPFFGRLEPSRITRAKVEGHKNLRRGQAADAPPEDSTVDGWLATLRHLLTPAREATAC
jgi:hypothetical protein